MSGSLISGSLQGGERGYPGCRKDGGLQVTAEWMSPDRGRMEVSRSPQNGVLQVAAEWRSPGRRRMEVSRSRPNGCFQVAAEWRSLGRRRSADHCGKVEVFVAIGWRYSNRCWVEVFLGSRSSGYRGVKVVTRWRSSDRHMVEVSRTQQDEGLEVAPKRMCPGRHMEETFKPPKDGHLKVA